MKRLNRTLLLIVICILPLVVVVGAINLTARMPDFYQYEFNSYEAADAVDLDVGNDALAEAFSDFMLGKTEELTLEAQYMGEEMDNVFSAEEQAPMLRLRTAVNLISLVGGALFLVLVASYVVLIRAGEKRRPRRAFLISIPVFLIFYSFLTAALLFPHTGETLKVFFLGGSFLQDGILIKILTPPFLLHGIIAVGAISVIYYIILAMLIWSMTKPYLMFGPRRRQ